MGCSFSVYLWFAKTTRLVSHTNNLFAAHCDVFTILGRQALASDMVEFLRFRIQHIRCSFFRRSRNALCGRCNRLFGSSLQRLCSSGSLLRSDSGSNRSRCNNNSRGRNHLGYGCVWLCCRCHYCRLRIRRQSGLIRQICSGGCRTICGRVADNIGRLSAGYCENGCQCQNHNQNRF